MSNEYNNSIHINHIISYRGYIITQGWRTYGTKWHSNSIYLKKIKLYFKTLVREILRIKFISL